MSTEAGVCPTCREPAIRVETWGGRPFFSPCGHREPEAAERRHFDVTVVHGGDVAQARHVIAEEIRQQTGVTVTADEIPEVWVGTRYAHAHGQIIVAAGTSVRDAK